MLPQGFCWCLGSLLPQGFLCSGPVLPWGFPVMLGFPVTPSLTLLGSFVLEIGMWWLDISTWKQSQPQSKQQEAKRAICNWQPQTANSKQQTAAFCHHLPLPGKVSGIGDRFGLISLSLLMYYFTLMQATLIHLHNKTRSALVTHHYCCLGTSSNQPWWI
jgi:hypothetical protein